MNKLTISGQISTTINGSSQTQPISNTLYISSSLGVQQGQLIPTGSWATINKGNITNLRVGVFINNDLTSSIYISPTNTASIASCLKPDDFIILTNITGSLIYATASGSNGSALLQYQLSDF